MTKKTHTPGRYETVRVKTARKRSNSSVRWLNRQLNDPYVQDAKRMGYRSRACFKLIELDDRFKFLKPGTKVVDLGAAPGGWTQVVAERIRPLKNKKSAIVGIDLLEIEDIPGATLLQGDFLEEEHVEAVREALGGAADVVLSDMAAVTTGHSNTDHLRIMALAEAALMFAEEVLSQGGTFIAKVFEGGSDQQLLMALKKAFKTVKHVKPAASRKESSEMYVVATGFRGENMYSSKVGSDEA